MKIGRIVFVLLAVTAAAATFAAAASLGVTSLALGAGNSSISACDPDGFTFSRSVNSSGQITSMTVSGIAAACAGGTLTLTITDTSDASIGSGSAALPSTGFSGSASITPSPTPVTPRTNHYQAIVVGP